MDERQVDIDVGAWLLCKYTQNLIFAYIDDLKKTKVDMIYTLDRRRAI